jgi:FixJ family two-component response regulator
MTISTVLVVDDDPSFLGAVTRLIRSAGFKVVGFERPSALLAGDLPKTNACMILDVHLREMTGVELYKTLSESNRILPAIMITGCDDPETKRLIDQTHPVAALFKPIEEKALFEAIGRALALSKNILT